MTSPGNPGRARLPVIAAALCALLLVGALVVAGLMYSRIHDDKAADRARGEAIAAAEQFALRMDGIELGNFEEYKKSVEPLLTTKEKTVFEQQFKQFEEVYKQAQSQGLKTSQAGVGKIIFSAANDVDQDSATVLVAHDSTVEGQDQSLHFRWQLGMRKVEGDWLVDDFTPVD
ncbi:MAG: hypothetical protein EOO74_03480 [Myxococcales bacterium]|nr:MAG: hypothetical protein EOO74_03480 [Myxococcales bacterium]